ncbi:putative reverse transcriptase domain, aspartic peptidase domain protein [Tanacetum coccineum]
MSDMIALLNDLSYIPPNNKQNELTHGDIGETSNESTQAKRNEFEELYDSANEELYPGCDYVTRLDFMVKFTYFKVKGKLTDSIFNEMLEFFQHVFPTMKGYKLPPSYSAIKKTFKMIGLGYESIHACCTEPGKMQHPVDGRAWKNFDTKYPNFAKEPRNVRLGLATDDFNPFGNLSQAYSMWPVLWALKGVETIDVATGQKFNMRAMVLWTINDFPARSILLVEVGEVAKPIIELCSFFKQICSATLMEDDMLKAQSKVVDILCNLELIYPPAFFDIMIHLVIHLPLEALEGGPIRPRPEIDTYRSQFKSKFPNKDMKEEFPDWFGSQIRQRHVDNDPGVSATSELFALACGPTPTPISVNSCVVNGVRFVVHSRDERRTTQNSGICSPGGKDGEMYYGQLQEILEFLYLSFKVVLFRVKWFDTSNEGRKVKHLVLRNNMTQILTKGQSTEVGAPPNIIDLDEDDDIIDDEDALPHDLADSDDEDLINVDDDEGVYVVYSSEEEIDLELCQRMWHGATAVMVAVMIGPLHTIYPQVVGVASLTGTMIIIDDEDVLLHDLVDSDDKDFVNVDDGDGVAVVYSSEMSAYVARGHGGDGCANGDDRSPSTSVSRRLPRNEAGHPKTQLGRKESRQDEYPQGNLETQIIDTILTRGWDHSGSLVPNLLGEIVKEFPIALCFLVAESRRKRKAGVLYKLGGPTCNLSLWPDKQKGINQHLGKDYSSVYKSSLRSDYWVKNLDRRDLRTFWPGKGRKDVLDVLVPRCNHTSDVRDESKDR